MPPKKKKPAATSPGMAPGPSYVVKRERPVVDRISMGTIKIPKKYLNPEHHGAISIFHKRIGEGALSAQEEASPFKDDLSQRISRSEITEHIALIQKFAPSALVAGSYRRGAAVSNDIDVIINEPLEPLIKKLTAAGYIKHTFSVGTHKFLGVVKHPTGKIHRHLDIIATTPESFPFALLYFTGNAKHNIIMRVKAKRLGLKLNEYGLFKDDRPIPGIKTEADIFTHIGVAYRTPEERNI